MHANVAALSSIEHLERGRYRGMIDPSWHTGRGAFGGLLAATLLDAMSDVVGDAERVPRSLTVHFCAPCTGPYELKAEVVRAGSRVTHATARIGVGGETTTFASASFCKDRREAHHYAHATMPRVEPALEARAVPQGVPGLPPFFRYVDARFCGDVMPFSGAAQPLVQAWVTMRDLPRVDAPIAAMLLDTLPPAMIATFTAPRAVASVDFTVHFFEHLPLATAISAPDADPHHLVSIASRWAGDGYGEELRDLWTPDGVLVAQCRQLLALL